MRDLPTSEVEALQRATPEPGRHGCTASRSRPGWLRRRRCSRSRPSFLVAVPVVVLAILAFAAWDIRRTWRTIDRETEAARARGFFC